MRRQLLQTLFLLALLLVGVEAQPRHLYLTWSREDTATTQTIVFQTLGKATEPRVEVRLASSSGKAKTIQSKTVVFRGLGRRVHWVTLTGLSPRTEYQFRAGDDRYGLSEWMTFRTLPADDSPIRVITGGDMYRHPETVDLLDAGSVYQPDVALVGGDIAYADGRPNRYLFWDDWLDNWSQRLKGPGGRIVPMILAIGNHEVSGGFGQPRRNAPYFFGYFPQGPNPYFTRKLGSEIDLVVLDSGHVTSHESQVPFLEQALEKSKARFKVALYHVPCYPTHRSFEGTYSKLGREHWVPVFDNHQLDLALENHDHVFKRTHPLKGNKINKNGTVYLGDGCWGRTPRTVAGRRWYHEKALPKEHIWLLQNRSDGLRCEAIDKQARIFDATTIKSHGRSTP